MSVDMVSQTEKRHTELNCTDPSAINDIMALLFFFVDFFTIPSLVIRCIDFISSAIDLSYILQLLEVDGN